MKLKRLELAQVRGFEQAEFKFEPDMNLLMGANGAGKSTVLDVLRILLSQVLSDLRLSRSRSDFEDSDICFDRDSLTSRLVFDIASQEATYLAHVQKSRYGAVEGLVFSIELDLSAKLDKLVIPTALRDEFRKANITLPRSAKVEKIQDVQDEFQKANIVLPHNAKVKEKQEPGKQWNIVVNKIPKYLVTYRAPNLVIFDSKVYGQVRNQPYTLESRYELTPNETHLSQIVAASTEQPLTVYYSTRRSLFTGAGRRSSSRSDVGTAYIEHLSPNRELRLGEFAEWWLVQAQLSIESPRPRFGRNMKVLADTASRFLEDCSNLRAVSEPDVTLVIDKPGGTLDVRQLSDGERSVLGIVLDLARRLALANPKLKDPLSEGEAIVLIDELDLHLHPKWQREIVGKLMKTFPKCQFIATTHSPQIVGEVESRCIQILYREDDRINVWMPSRSFGLDSNRVLEELMDTPERTPYIQEELGKLFQLIDDEDFVAAKKQIDLLETLYDPADAELVRARTLIAFLEGTE